MKSRGLCGASVGNFQATTPEFVENLNQTYETKMGTKNRVKTKISELAGLSDGVLQSSLEHRNFGKNIYCSAMDSNLKVLHDS